jgi:hypothetical protein
VERLVAAHATEKAELQQMVDTLRDQALNMGSAAKRVSEMRV